MLLNLWLKTKITIDSLLSEFPVFKRFIRRLRNSFYSGEKISSGYIALQGEEANSEGWRLRNSWQDSALPRKQRALVERQLHKYRYGAPIDVFDVFTSCLRSLSGVTPGMSLLEIGCSSGFYSEVLEISGLPLRYAGCDYSEAFIRLAREKYPSIEFAVEDATALNYPDRNFDIVVSGCCLLHIPEYVKAIEETARVARCYAIFHRTPVVWGQPEQWYRKQAYGVETVEIHFNETEFLALLQLHGLELLATHTLYAEEQDVSSLIGHAIRTYVCRKK
ncbi:AdoMet_MTases domain containing protein [Burkholderiaceae bacterium]